MSRQNLHRRTFVQALSAFSVAGLGSAFSRVVHAQDSFPSRPITLIVPQAAGGGADLLCRTLQGKMQTVLGQPVIIENRAGAGGNIGTAAGARAAADGYTATFVNLSTMALNPYLYSKVGYAITDFEPLVWMASVANILVVKQDLPVNTLQELIALAKKKPGALTYSSAGNGSGNHLGGEMLKSLAKIDITHVPYKGGGPAILAVLAGEVDASIADPLAALPYIKAGKMKALGLTSARASASLPNVPPIADIVPGYEATSWAGLVVPKGTPAAAARKLAEATLTALKDPVNSEKLAGQLYEPVAGDASQFAQLIASENAKWSKLIKQLGMRID